MIEIIISFAPAVAPKFIQDQDHQADRYLQSKSLPVLASAKQPCTFYVAVTVYLTYIIQRITCIIETEL